MRLLCLPAITNIIIWAIAPIWKYFLSRFRAGSSFPLFFGSFLCQTSFTGSPLRSCSVCSAISLCCNIPQIQYSNQSFCLIHLVRYFEHLLAIAYFTSRIFEFPACTSDTILSTGCRSSRGRCTTQKALFCKGWSRWPRCCSPRLPIGSTA